MKVASWNRGLRLPFAMLAALLSIVAASGCSGPDVELGTVTGTFTIDGKPQEGIWINFMPDPSADTPGGMSTAVTDANGKYELTYDLFPDAKGAVVGKHRVVLNDFAAENFRGAGRPPRSRIEEKYMLALKTPIIVEVKSGPQQIDIEMNDF